MARSAFDYVRGGPAKFYDWLSKESVALPEGPAIWVCGDCHVGNLGPTANEKGSFKVEIRDFDRTVIGNPVHDLIRLGLSLVGCGRLGSSGPDDRRDTEIDEQFLRSRDRFGLP
jgi:uncharacterized protein (DUF2252 family)